MRAQDLNWYAKLNMTKVELELISDGNMYVLFDKGMRGGVSYISKRQKKPTISIWNVITWNKNQKMLHT